MKLLNLINRTLEGTFYKNLISKYFGEVSDDIKILKCNNSHYNNSNSILNCFYQDDDRFDDELDYELITKVQEINSKKYKEKYCPTCLYDFFNQSERMNYIMLRVEIDKLLGIKDTYYKI